MKPAVFLQEITNIYEFRIDRNDLISQCQQENLLIILECMDQNSLRLRTLLIDIGDKLSNDDRITLGFLLADDVPRRDLDTIARDKRTSMNIIWETLINRQKITPENVDYLILRLENIRRMDLVRQLKQYSSTVKSGNPVVKSSTSSDLFNRIDP
ncbi:unnamed protein product [Rotaria magnacalcarata]